jgi:hypothetical protein
MFCCVYFPLSHWQRITASAT